MTRPRTTIVAIAKNEGRYIAEWIAYHFSIGADRIVVYDNDSSDLTPGIVRTLGRRFPVALVDWPSGSHRSPQRAAYNDALRREASTDWLAFIDIDEFIVPFGYASLPAFVAAIPADVAMVGINWRLFGSAGRTDDAYESVLETFTRCSRPEQHNNTHIKSLVRPGCVAEMHIHHADLAVGRSVDSAFAPLVLPRVGRMAAPVYEGIQINHYMTKTYAEFARRKGNGNANYNPRHTSHFGRPATPEGFRVNDRNELTDETLPRLLPGFRAVFAQVRAALGEPASGDTAPPEAHPI